MKELFSPHFSWTFFGMTVLMLLFIYIVLNIAKNQVQNIAIFRKNRVTLFHFFRRTLLLYELFFAIVGGSVFLLLNPIWHGLLILFIVTVGFPLIRNYMIGKLLCFDYDFQIGKAIVAAQQEGVISKINGLGIYVMTNKGMHYLNYAKLQAEGFSLLAANDMNEYCYLNIRLKEDATEKLSVATFMYQLMAVPYLDDSYKPTLGDQEDKNRLQVRVLIRKGNHRKELVNLIKDWGYQCELSY